MELPVTLAVTRRLRHGGAKPVGGVLPDFPAAGPLVCRTSGRGVQRCEAGSWGTGRNGPTLTQKLMAAADYEPTSESCLGRPRGTPSRWPQRPPTMGPFLWPPSIGHAKPRHDGRRGTRSIPPPSMIRLNQWVCWTNQPFPFANRARHETEMDQGRHQTNGQGASVLCWDVLACQFLQWRWPSCWCACWRGPVADYNRSPRLRGISDAAAMTG
jgi:hypothetical protein